MRISPSMVSRVHANTSGHHSGLRAGVLAMLFWPTLGLAIDAGIVGRNTNIIGPPPPNSSALADRGHRQQNEPSCAINPANTLQICCGFNDYRGIDVPGLGDAWEGIACSTDGGRGWNSQLIPGHRADPEFSLNLSFAADPNLVATPGALIYNYIAADRDHVGGLYVQHYVWRNKEDGWPLLAVGGPKLVSKGTNGKFIDKPFTFGFGHEEGEATVSLDWDGGSRTLPAGNLGLAAAVFVGNDNNDGTKILYWDSDDWGQSWSQPTKLTESKGVNSGINMAANGDNVCAIWRRFDDTNEVSSILYACSANRGKKFDKAKVIADICPFDQTTLNGDAPIKDIVSFRSNAFPVLAADGDNFYAFWADRGYAEASGGPAGCNLVTPEGGFNPSYSRIVYSVSSNGGKSWSAPKAIEDNVGGDLLTGHQFMPAAYGANGEVVLAWIDNRDDVTRAYGLELDIDKQMIVDFWDGEQALYRHSADIRSTRLKKVGGQVEVAPSIKVSNYTRGLVLSGGQLKLKQLEYNLVNARLFQQGTAPFIGDYLSVTAPGFVQDNSGLWRSSNSVPGLGRLTSHITWAENRDVRGNAWGNGDAEGFNAPSPYTPVVPATTDGAENVVEETNNDSPSVQDPPDSQQEYCAASAKPADRTRDQNVYSAPIYPDARLTSPGAIKTTGAGVGTGGVIQRAMPVFIENYTSTSRYFKLTIDGQPPDAGSGGLASFDQFGQPLNQVWVKIYPRSSAARTVFVQSMEALPSIPVSAEICDNSKANCEPVAQVLLNHDPLQLGSTLEQPDSGASSIFTQELHDPELLNPNLLNPDVLALLISNPDLLNALIAANPNLLNAELLNTNLLNESLRNVVLANPDLLNPDLLNPNLLNLLLSNPTLLNQGLLNIDPLNPNLLNPDLLNPDLLNPALWDLVVANPDLLNPDLLNPDLLNDLVENPTLLNPDLLNLIVENPDGQTAVRLDGVFRAGEPVDNPRSVSDPSRFVLRQNVPNPFNPVTTIRFEIPREAAVQLAVFDVRGRRVTTLHQGPIQAGYHDATWEGRDDQGRAVASGMYVVRLTGPGFSDARKMLLAR